MDEWLDIVFSAEVWQFVLWGNERKKEYPVIMKLKNALSCPEQEA